MFVLRNFEPWFEHGWITAVVGVPAQLRFVCELICWISNVRVFVQCTWRRPQLIGPNLIAVNDIPFVSVSVTHIAFRIICEVYPKEDWGMNTHTLASARAHTHTTFTLSGQIYTGNNSYSNHPLNKDCSN